MAYRAFVVGANYGLKYAVDDAQRIATVLQSLGYELPEPLIPPPEEDNHKLIARFKDFAAACRSEDTLLFYFAGHGIVHNGLLYLLLETYNSRQNPLQTCLSMIEISGVLQSADTSNKLVILDCCHAGTAFRFTDFDFSDNYLVLTASESFEKALELKDHKAGFLSHHLHNALTTDLANVKQNSSVDLNALLTYLRDRVTDHNRASTDKVPEITVVSKQKHDMVLAELANPYLLLSGLVCVNPAFLDAESAKTGSLYTPENFYGALPPVQWWGVINGLVAEQTLYEAVVQHVRQAIHAAYPPVIALLHGSGGMGKSVMLRRLGVDLAAEVDVWWLDEPQTLLEEQENAQAKLLESGRLQLILLDDWSSLDPDSQKALRGWFEHLVKSGDGQTIKFVLTSRYWQAEQLPWKLIYANSLFDFDQLGNLARDNPVLLDKAVAQLGGSDWDAAAQELHSPQMAQTKPFHLLFVLMRLSEDAHLRAKLIAKRGSSLGFEHIFLDIIQDDLENLWRDDYKKGLAAAVSTMAYLHMQYRPYLSRTAFVKLSDRYNPTYPLLTSSHPADWGILKYYLYTHRNPIKNWENNEYYIAFIKDDFAESIAALDKHGHHHVENRWAVDLDFLIREAEKYSASVLFAKVCQISPFIWTFAQKQELIEHLLQQDNNHHAYAQALLYDNVLDDESKRWQLIQRYLEIVETNHSFNSSFLLWAKQFAPERVLDFAHRQFEIPDGLHGVSLFILVLMLGREEARPFAKKLLEQTDGQSSLSISAALKVLEPEEARPFAKKLLEQTGQVKEVICTALGLLEPEEARPFAKKLLEQTGQDKEAICTALGLLEPEEARPFAKKLLEQTGQGHQVICTAIGLLGREAEDYALAVLENWKVHPMNVVLRCLNVVPECRQAEQLICVALNNKNDWLYFQVLRYPFPKIKCWRQETRKIIKNWRKYNRSTLECVFNHYLDDQEFLKQPCQAILNRWKDELDYLNKHSYYPGHIIKALAHPKLRKQAKDEATKMILYESVNPGFLREGLRSAAEAIVKENRYPDWIIETVNDVVEELPASISISGEDWIKAVEPDE
ncbi:MAG: caspase family protein [Desulfobacteraceae bacterium]|jgi:hypothetical protein